MLAAVLMFQVSSFKFNFQGCGRCSLKALKFAVMFCRSDATSGKTMTLAGPRAWTVDEVIALCEKYADARADVSHLHLPPMLCC